MIRPLILRWREPVISILEGQELYANGSCVSLCSTHKNSAYPGMKGLDNRLFIKQLDYVITHYVCVTVADVVAAFYQDQPLPKILFY